MRISAETIRVSPPSIRLVPNGDGPVAWVAPILIAEFPHSASPLIVSESGSMELRKGEAFAAHVVAPGAPTGYQWFHNVRAMDQQTGASLLIGPLTSDHAGIYHVVARNAEGTADSPSANLACLPPFSNRLLP